MTYKQFFKHRSIWMGLAMLLVIIFHIPLKFSTPVMKNLQRFGYGGVDFFLFASGLGCTFSYKRCSSLLKFIKRRLLRIYPSYLFFLIIWIPVFSYLHVKMPFRYVIGNILGIQYFANRAYTINWYFYFILLLYFAAPFLIELIDRTKRFHLFAAVLAVLLLLSVPFINQFDQLIMVSRLPVFAIGIYFAAHFDLEDKISKKTVLILLGLSFAGLVMLKLFYNRLQAYMYSFGLWWYPFILITPGACLLISWLCGIIENLSLKALEKMLWMISKIASFSLELYLIHIFFLDIHNHFFQEPEPLTVFLTVLLSFAAAYLLNKAANSLER